MQTRLFGRRPRAVAPICHADMRRVLLRVCAAPALRSFRIWLIGSRLEPGRNGADVDLLLSPREGISPDEDSIERALWYSRHYGLFQANPACVIDPCYRAAGPTLDFSALQPDALLKGIKLFSPKILEEVVAGRIRDYRRVGSFSIEYSRRAAETGYYRKLPMGSFDGRPSRYLRPAIEVLLPERSEAMALRGFENFT